MRVFSVEEAKNELASFQTEMEDLASNMVKGVDRSESLARLNEIQPRVDLLTAKVEDAGDDVVESVRVDAGLNDDVLEVESTVSNVLSVIDSLLTRVMDVYAESNDETRSEIAKRVNSVSVISEAAGMKSSSGKGSRLAPQTVTDIRNKFRTAWEANNDVGYTEFIRDTDIATKLYTVIQIVNGESYATVDGPVRGVEYDVEMPTDEAVAA